MRLVFTDTAELMPDACIHSDTPLPRISATIVPGATQFMLLLGFVRLDICAFGKNYLYYYNINIKIVQILILHPDEIRHCPKSV